MRTRILKLARYQEIELSDELLAEPLSEDKIDALVQAELDRIAQKNGEIVPADAAHPIQEGDIVMLRVQSEIQKYHKPVLPLNVGKGLFDLDFERAILGLRTQEMKSIAVPGGTCTVTVLSIKTRTTPELSLEMVQSDIQDGSKPASIEEYCLKFRQELEEMALLEQYFAGAAAVFRDEIIARSEYEIDEEELSSIVEQQFRSIEAEARQSGESLDTYLMTLFSNPQTLSHEDLIAKVRHNLRQDLLFQLYAKALLGSEVAVSEQEYREALASYARASGESVETLAQVWTYEQYCQQAYVSKLQNLLIEEYRSRPVRA